MEHKNLATQVADLLREVAKELEQQSSDSAAYTISAPLGKRVKQMNTLLNIMRNSKES